MTVVPVALLQQVVVEQLAHQVLHLQQAQQVQMVQVYAVAVAVVVVVPQ